MTYRLFLVTLVLGIFVACKSNDKGTDIIERDKFIDLLVDIHLADGYLSAQGYRAEVEHGKTAEEYAFVLQKHQVTPKQFMSTLKYYSKHTMVYDEIYNKVIEKLTKLQTEHAVEKISDEIKRGS